MARTQILLCSSLLFHFISPSVKKRRFWRCTGSLGKNDFPFLFGVVEQTVEVDIVHQGDPYHCRQPRKAPLPGKAFPHLHQQQVCNQCHPYLDLDGVGAFAIKVLQREVLFYLLEKQLNLPSLTVYGDNLFGIRLHIVGKQRYELAFLDIHISDYT